MSDHTDENNGSVPESALTTASSVNSAVQTINLEEEVKKSFIDYAMSVIVDRALPDVRDGLKPVHRRVLFDMYDLKVWHNVPTKKSARIVGDVIGRFHPHGDAAVYETIVRMAQWFSMREPLIFGQGNFGDIDGDGAAAMRYTEVRMTKIAELMLKDIDKDTVDTYANYDGSEQIPEVLPTRFPNLLVNGSSGIAVGMATNIPTHNLAEVIDATLAMLDKPDIELDELMHYLPGPDFPTGGIIVGTDGVKQAYATGRGRCVIRARTHTETDKSGRQTIIVDEIPYVVHKVDIVKQIAQMVKDKKLEGIAEVNDLSDKDNAVRIAIDLKRDAFEEAVLNNLFQNTMLQSSFAINMVALVHNHPRQLCLKDILKEFIEFRREVVTRRTVYMLRQDRNKAHIAEGKMVAKANIQRVIDLITSSANKEEAKTRLMQENWSALEIAPLIERTPEGINLADPQGIPADRGVHGDNYFLSEKQADAILALQLSSLTHLEQDVIRDGYKELVGNIKGYLEILNNPERMKAVIREEMQAVREEYKDKRRTGFMQDLGKFDKAELIARQDVIVTMSAQGYVKYQDIASYESQRRGGKGRLAAKLKDEDYVTSVVVANTHDNMMFFTSKGRAFVQTVYDLPTSDNKTWRGRPIQNLFKIEEGERITAMLPIAEFDENTYVMLATKLGRVKKISLSAFRSFLKRNNDAGIKVINLKPDDELVGADISNGDDDVILFSSDGRALRFCEFWQRKDGQDAGDGDEGETENETETESASDNTDESAGDAEDKGIDRHSGNGIRASGRGTGATRGIKLRGNATMVSMIVLAPSDPNHQCLIASDNGFGKRLDLWDIPFHGRGGQGVFVMRQSDRNGGVVGAVRGDEQSEFMLITNGGVLIRSPMNSVALRSRQAQGNILMRVQEGEQIIAVQAIPEDVVENSRRTQEARAAEKKALLGQENGTAPESASAPAAGQSPEASAEEGAAAPDANETAQGGADPASSDPASDQGDGLN